MCGGCFAGLLGPAAPLKEPDCSPGSFPKTVETIEEALHLERPRQGSFQPDLSRASSKIADWASPLPRRNDSTAEQVTGDFDFDLVIDEGGPATVRLSSQLDTDIPAGRIGVETTFAPRSRYEIEQLVASPGNLPRPMTADEREDAIRRLLPTATYEMLAKVPRELLSNHDETSHQLRRQLIRGATIVYVTAGLPGKRFTFEIAAALGVKVVILDNPDSWSSSLVEAGIAAKFLPVDMTQTADEIFHQALNLIKELGQDGKTGPVDGVTSFVELSIPLVARITEALGLPGHRPQAVDSARDKHATRASLKAAGLPTPRNCLIRSEEEIATAMKQVGFPAVIKPVSGAASLGVKKVVNEADLKQTYREVVAELSTLVVSSGALIQGSPDGNGIKANESINLTVLMEQFLDGDEVDVDVVMSEGEYRYACVSDNGPTLEPYFNETWAVCPSLLSRDKQVGLKELSIASVKALGFTSGVFHVECKYTSSGPQLIEVNARMGGGQVHECNLRTWGVCLVEETLIASLGIPARPKVPKQPLTAIAYCYVNAMKSGIVKDMSGLEALRQRQNVVWAKPLTRVGIKAVGPADGLPTWLCDLFVQESTAQKALEFLQALEAEQPVKVE